ncbi:hypothetical protein [Thiomonas sp.]|uniref:hypothetical protein n=1 Tax=Thiomonas sp. TaxID=2047785 RepID=UPI00260845A7|nr:hypothetical protein [Thiomonas sp.]
MSWTQHTLTLRQIAEEHPAVTAFLTEIGLPPPRLPDLPIPLDDRARAALLRLADIAPIRVVPTRSESTEPTYRVVGGIRTIRFLSSMMGPQTTVPVWVAQGRLTAADIRELLTAELLLSPALTGYGRQDLVAIGCAWTKVRECADAVNLIPDWSVRHLAKFYRVTEQRLTSPRAVAKPLPVEPSAQEKTTDTK